MHCAVLSAALLWIAELRETGLLCVFWLLEPPHMSSSSSVARFVQCHSWKGMGVCVLNLKQFVARQ